MNVDRCYPTADMAKVASCVGSDEMIKVEVHVKKVRSSLIILWLDNNLCCSRSLAINPMDSLTWMTTHGRVFSKWAKWGKAAQVITCTWCETFTSRESRSFTVAFASRKRSPSIWCSYVSTAWRSAIFARISPSLVKMRSNRARARVRWNIDLGSWTMIWWVCDRNKTESSAQL